MRLCLIYNERMNEKRHQGRRLSRRVEKPVPTLVFWKGKSGRHTADICDVSIEGCFLNTSGRALDGEYVTLEFPLSIFPERIAKIGATVVPQRRKLMGFGLRFVELTKEQQSYLVRLMARTPEVKDRRRRSESK